MSALEFDIIDELYFVTGFSRLAELLPYPEAEIEKGLRHLLTVGYVKGFYPDPDTELPAGSPVLEARFEQCFFLASKAGLLAHNSK